MDCTTTLRIAEAALSPIRAYEWFNPMRKVWGYGKDPDRACLLLGRNPKIKRLIWC